MCPDKPRSEVVVSTRPPRIAILWQGLSGYFQAQLRALAAEGAEVLPSYRSSGVEAPFDDDALTDSTSGYAWTGEPNEGELNELLDRFEPDAVLVSSWHIGPYRRAARRRRGSTLRILCMDNQWAGTAKQWAGVASARWVIQPAYDAVLVAGDRQADFAERLGFSAEDIIWGLYTCDYPLYAAVAERRGPSVPPSTFLYVGRLVRSKGVDVMLQGYRRYRARESAPWPLRVAGTGPLAEDLREVAGVEMLGFVQPGELPAVLADAGCLLLPSRFEPWGVVVHEATAAGLPIICTRACGAATRLVLDGYNGVMVSTDDAAAVGHGLSRITNTTESERRAMSTASSSLARQYSPHRWASTLLRRIAELRQAASLTGPAGTSPSKQPMP